MQRTSPKNSKLNVPQSLLLIPEMLLKPVNQVEIAMKLFVRTNSNAAEMP